MSGPTGLYWLLVAFLVFVALTGGASRADEPQLIVLRPAAALMIGIAAWNTSVAELQRLRFLFCIAASCVALTVVQLVPLPPSIWEALPGRALEAEIGKMTEGSRWRPISLVPFSTWNALYSTMIPIAVLLLAARLPQQLQRQLLYVFLIAGGASVLLAVVQVISGHDNSVYLYPNIDIGSAVGLFANRNHQAVLLSTMFPMLAAFAAVKRHSVERARLWLWLSIAAASAIVPLILVTGSRLGLLVAVIGLVSVPFLSKPATVDGMRRRTAGRFGSWYVAAIAVGAITLLATVTAFTSRGLAIDRLFLNGVAGEGRIPIWIMSTKLIWQYFPIGSGLGSFVETYQIAESNSALKVEYVNHAHNEFIEIALTGGTPGAAILLLVVIGWLRGAILAFRQPIGASNRVLFARLGAVIILMIGVSSIGDYPVRTPLLACLLTVSAIWLAGAWRDRKADNP